MTGERSLAGLMALRLSGQLMGFRPTHEVSVRPTQCRTLHGNRAFHGNRFSK
jgi:hypothetical protein